MSWRVYVKNHPKFGTMYQRVEKNPSWVTKAALATVFLVIVIPLAVLTITALILGLTVFITLGFIAFILRTLRNLFTGSPSRPTTQQPQNQNGGRENVRIIENN